MRAIVRAVLLSSVAVTLAATLLVLSVALAGQEITFETAVRSCIRFGGVLLAVAALAFVVGLAVAAKSLNQPRDTGGPWGRK